MHLGMRNCSERSTFLTVSGCTGPEIRIKGNTPTRITFAFNGRVVKKSYL